MRGAGLRPMLRLFLMTLATYMDADGSRCWPPMQTLADDLGVKRATVNDLKNEAMASGWLDVISKGGVGRNGGQGKTNRYSPRIPDEAQLSGDRPTVEADPISGNSQVATAGNRRVAARRNHTNQRGGQLPYPSRRDWVQALLVDAWPGRINQRRHVEPIVALVEDSGWTEDQVIDVFATRTDDAESMAPLSLRLERVAHRPTFEAAMQDRVLLGYLGRLKKRRGPHTPYGDNRPRTQAEHTPSGRIAF